MGNKTIKYIIQVKETPFSEWRDESTYESITQATQFAAQMSNYPGARQRRTIRRTEEEVD